MASPNNKKQRSLQHGLTSRQVSMISIAGIIGAGLFIGSSNAIATAGPAILISYAMTGLLVLLVMRMLGEMAIANPNSGSFSTYAPRPSALGRLYHRLAVLVVLGADHSGRGHCRRRHPARLLPGVPSWLFAFLIMVVLSGTNLVSVKNFGAFEYWFALVKVVAIIAFIVVCSLAVFGFWPLAEVSGSAACGTTVASCPTASAPCWVAC
jgi:GABA permease